MEPERVMRGLRVSPGNWLKDDGASRKRQIFTSFRRHKKKKRILSMVPSMAQFTAPFDKD